MSPVQETAPLPHLLGSGASRWQLGVTIAGTVIVLLGALLLVVNGWDWQTLLEWKRQIGTLPFFLGLALLPLIGVPTTPLFVIAGATFGLSTALTGTAISIAVNLVLSFWLARYLLKKPLTRLLQRGNYDLPQFTPGKALSFLILMRLVPGLPTFLKNYSTALVDVPFGIYLSISWGVTYLYSVSLIVLGDSLYKGDFREGALALLILVAIVAGFAWINQRQKRIFADGDNDKISVLKNNMVQPVKTLSYQALTLRVIKMIAVLTLLWGILAQNAGWTFASEFIIAAVLSSMFFAMLLPTQYSFIGLSLFACYFVVEALRGGLDVAWRAAQPQLPITPGWTEYRLTLPQGAPQVLFLNSVSLLPGTLSVALNDNVVVVHSLGTDADAQAELARLEYWVMRVFAAPQPSAERRLDHD